jgi:putative ubiquitin-RnfH superfamily antitoxin RatB of RatAB toxin-antitoxin module
MAEPVKHSVAVCYALPDASFLVQLDVAAGTTIAEAIAASGALSRDRPRAQ